MHCGPIVIESVMMACMPGINPHPHFTPATTFDYNMMTRTGKGNTSKKCTDKEYATR